MALHVSFCCNMLGSDASVDCLFCLMTSLWTDERNHLSLDTLYVCLLKLITSVYCVQGCFISYSKSKLVSYWYKRRLISKLCMDQSIKV